MIENKNVLVMLSLAVIASGCASTETPTAKSSSVSVVNFSAFPGQVRGGQQVRLTMTLRNDGEVEAKNVQARLFNVPFAGAAGGNTNTWRLTSGTNRTVEFGSIKPERPETNLPAGKVTEGWQLYAPELKEGVTIPYQFLSEIMYKYRTRGTTRLTLMSQSRFREQGGTASRPVIDQTTGPVKIEVRTRTPLVFYSDGQNPKTTEMCVVVRNTGTGTPFLHGKAYDKSRDEEYSIEERDANKVRLKIPDQGRIEFVPPKGESRINERTAEVELFGNKGISCWTVRVRKWNQGVGPQEEVPVIMEAIYGYTKETSASVTVEGTGNTQSNTGNGGGGGQTERPTSTPEPPGG